MAAAPRFGAASFPSRRSTDGIHSIASRNRPRRRTGTSGPGLILALFSVPGSTLAVDLFSGGGFVIGAPLAIAAIVVGTQARRRSQAGRGMAIAAIVIAGMRLAQMAVWTFVAVIS